MIVKIQIPLFTTEDPQAMVYDENRTVDVLFPIDKDLRRIMKGRPKAFFYAEVRKKLLHINNEAPWQDW